MIGFASILACQVCRTRHREADRCNPRATTRLTPHCSRRAWPPSPAALNALTRRRARTDRLRPPRWAEYAVECAAVAAPRELRKPPITEALIDFRVLLSTPVSREALQPLVTALQPEFPDVQEQHDIQAEFRVEQGRVVPPETRQIFQGIKLSKDGGRRQVQFRTDGFTFNNVGKYIGGDGLIEETLALWPRYVAVARPERVNRLAMRDINTLPDLPWREGDPFDRFLNAAAELPEPGPQAVSEFLSRVVAHDPLGATAIVTQRFAPGTDGVHPFQLMIDVDVFFAKEIGTDPAELRQMLTILRGVKNRSFFSVLTDEAVMLYA